MIHTEVFDALLEFEHKLSRERCVPLHRGDCAQLTITVGDTDFKTLYDEFTAYMDKNHHFFIDGTRMSERPAEFAKWFTIRTPLGSELTIKRKEDGTSTGEI